MTQRTLLDIIQEAVTATISPSQLAGIPHDPEVYDVVGDVPMPVRYLHNACCEMADESQTLHTQLQQAEMAEDSATYQQVAAQMKTLHQAHEIISNLRWALFREAFPHPCSNYDGVAILEDWKMAGTIKTDQDGIPPELEALFERLAGSGLSGGIGILVMGRRQYN